MCVGSGSEGSVDWVWQPDQTRRKTLGKSDGGWDIDGREKKQSAECACVCDINVSIILAVCATVCLVIRLLFCVTLRVEVRQPT